MQACLEAIGIRKGLQGGHRLKAISKSSGCWRIYVLFILKIY